MDRDYTTVICSLSETIADYRQNEITPITPLHIERWLDQFESADRFVILKEIDSIMKRFYFSKNRVRESIRSFLKNEVIRNRDPRDILHHTGFLCIQQDGSSQRAMLDIVDEILLEEYKIPIAMTGIKDIKTYVYISENQCTQLKFDFLRTRY